MIVFTEIFHEQLATISRATATNLTADSWSSRHPARAPYFAEYAPLIRSDGGVERFSPEMAFELYFPKDDKLTDQERDYVRLLLDHAERSDRFPVLTDTRSLGRVRHLKQSFGGVHILLMRDPFRQWCSYTEQAARGNSYFLHTNRLICESAGDAEWISHLPDAPASVDFLSFQTFCRHALLHLNLYNVAAAHADLTIIYDRLEDETYRSEIMERLRSVCGIELDLSDFRETHQFSLVDFPSTEVLDQLVAIAMNRESGGMLPEVETLYSMMKESIERHVSEAGQLVKFSREKLAELTSMVEQLSERCSELEALRLSLAAMTSERDLTGADRMAARSEASALQAQLEKAQEELEGLKGQLAASRSETEAARDER